MRVNEVVQLNEGPMDWLARKGFFGTKSAQNAWASKLASDAEAGQNKQEAEAYARNLRSYLMNMESSGKLIIKKPGVTTPIPADKSIEYWLKQYFDQALRNYKLPPGWNLNDEINRFATEYKGAGKLPPAATTIWQAVQAIKPIAGPQAQADQAASAGGPKITGAPPPNVDIPLADPWFSNDPANNQNVVYSFDKASQTWTQYKKVSGTARRGRPATVTAGTPLATIDNTRPEWQKLNDMYATEVSRL